MKQHQALQILKTGKNVFLTGSAGAGKTYTLNQYIQYLRVRKVLVAVTASTGIAATHANGMTIHTWSGIGVKDSLTEGDLAKMKERKYLRDHMQKAQVLIIDEISMLHAKQLDMVNQVLKYFKENTLPFGGIQVVFSGDFFQLPPVGNQEETNREKFAFMSKAWVEAQLVVCYLEEQFRQEDSRLDDILNEIRAGEVSQRSQLLLQETLENSALDNIAAPKLYTHNLDVDRINVQHLMALQSKPVSFEAETDGNTKLVDLLKNSVRTDEKLELKLGAKVMFVKNNFERGYINGSLGEVVAFVQTDEGVAYPKVRLRNGKEIVAEPETWSIEEEKGKVLASFKQVPLRLAWAITIHKSQGMTLEAAEIDLRNTFERGQGYVALSRLKSLDGLRLLGFNNTALELDPLAMKADARFKELSKQAEMQWDDDACNALHKAFILSSGGTNDEREIKHQMRKWGIKTEAQKKEEETKKEKSEKKDKKEKKERKTESGEKDKRATHLITKELLDNGMSLEQVAEERGLVVSTIVGHLAKIYEAFPDYDVQRFKPEEGIMKKIKQAYRHLTAELETNTDPEKPKEVGMKALFDYFEGQYGYDVLRLAMFFLE